MCIRKLRLSLIAITGVALVGNLAWATGFRLGETKEKLKLDYDVQAVDHRNGRVTVNLTIADEGRLKPLRAVDLVVLSNDEQDRKNGFVDLSLSLAPTGVDGKQQFKVHLKKELALRAEIQFKTSTLDDKTKEGKWYYHAIPLAEIIKNAEPAFW